MTKITLQLFGHYDSRGGTVAVEADTKEAGLEAYVHSALWGNMYDSPEDIAELKENLGDDENGEYLGQFTLEGAELIPSEFTSELEGDIEECDLAVLVRKDDEHQLLLISHKGVIEDPDNIPGYPEHEHRSWSDDAYSFWLIRKAS